MRWLADQDERLKTLLAEKYSASAIASILSREFKVDLSRNSIIGRAHRKNWQLGCGKRPPPKPKRRLVRRQPKPRPEPKAVFMYEPRKLEPDDDPRSLSGCQFILGDPREDYRKCLQPQEDGSVYCRHHHLICYMPASSRQDRKNIKNIGRWAA